MSIQTLHTVSAADNARIPPSPSIEPVGPREGGVVASRSSPERRPPPPPAPWRCRQVTTDLWFVPREALAPLGRLVPLPSLPGACVKHAAQGSALIADSLAGGRFAPLADALELRSARGTIWDAVGASRLISPAPSSSI